VASTVLIAMEASMGSRAKQAATKAATMDASETTDVHAPLRAG
jgi:hypothetical protein